MYKIFFLAYFSLGSLYAGISTGLLHGLTKLKKSPNRFRKKFSGISEKSYPFVTVLIAARNEEQRIEACLQSLLTQNYPRTKLQIIVVNDRSTDGTGEILEIYKPRFKGILEVLHLTESMGVAGVSPKKFAISSGFSLARGEIILSTDADSRMGPKWIESMVEKFEPDIGLVQGMTLCRHIPGQNELFAGIQSLEYFSLNLVSAAVIGAGFPIHGNANNLAYRKEVFSQMGGFSSNQKIVSGDDDFLLQSINSSGNWKVVFCTSPFSQVHTEPAESWKQFWEQRKRWASKCIYYKKPQMLMLLSVFLFYSIILILLPLGFFSKKLFFSGMAGWSFKTLADLLVMHKGAEIFNQKRLLKWFIPTAIIHIPLIVSSVIAGNFGKFNWKGHVTSAKLK